MQKPTLGQNGTYMAMTTPQLMEDVERSFGSKGQEVVSEALRKIGYDAAKQMFEHAHFPEGTSDIEKVSFASTQINTVTWTSIEKPKIISKNEALFDILWCRCPFYGHLGHHPKYPLSVPASLASTCPLA